MKTNDDERYFYEIMKEDMPLLVPDPGIEERLGYALQLKENRKRASENSFLSIITGFSTMRHLGIKASIITGLLLIVLLFNKLPERGGYHLRNIPLLADSSYCDTLSDDSINWDKNLK
jgi:hypothetical protein